MYCQKCGKPLPDGDCAYCPNCGHPIRKPQQNVPQENQQDYKISSTDEMLVLIAKIFGLLNIIGSIIGGCLIIVIAITIISSAPSKGTVPANANQLIGGVWMVFGIISILSIAWQIPMECHMWSNGYKKAGLSTGFKICVMLFFNLVSGILLLCMSPNSKRD